MAIIYNDSRAVLVRISKLKERLKERPKTRFDFFKDSSKVISICAFILSIAATIYSWRKDDIHAREVARREFDATVQQAIDNGFKNFEFNNKNKYQQNIGSMLGWFNTQASLFQNKAIQQLADLDDASMFDYIIVANIITPSHPARATALLKKAIQIGLEKTEIRHQFPYNLIAKIKNKPFVGKFLGVSVIDDQTIRDLGNAYMSLGQVFLSQKRNEEAKEAYEAAIHLFDNSKMPIESYRYHISTIYKFWAEAEANNFFDCNSSVAHFRKAEEYFPEALKVLENVEWTSIQYELTYTTSRCSSDGKYKNLQMQDFDLFRDLNTPPPWPTTNDANAGLNGN